MIPRLRSRAPGTRTARYDPRERRLESLAGEFALLTQRRARMGHQLELLDQQRAATAGNLYRVQARLVWLSQQMGALDPELLTAEPYDMEPEPPPPPPPPPARPVKAAKTPLVKSVPVKAVPVKPVTAKPGSGHAAPNRGWIATANSHRTRPGAGRWG